MSRPKSSVTEVRVGDVWQSNGSKKAKVRVCEITSAGFVRWSGITIRDNGIARDFTRNRVLVERDGNPVTVERLGDSETTPAESLPVTPAERAVAPMLRAWRDWRPSPDDPKGCRDLLVDFGSGAMSVGFVDALDLTPVGRELLARVDASEQATASYATAPQLTAAKERSPENVLRAMAASYANAWINEGEDEDWEGHLYAVREALRECLSSGSPGYMPQQIADDYEARRTGARGMHDPPMGAS